MATPPRRRVPSSRLKKWTAIVAFLSAVALLTQDASAAIEKAVHVCKYISNFWTSYGKPDTRIEDEVKKQMRTAYVKAYVKASVKFSHALDSVNTVHHNEMVAVQIRNDSCLAELSIAEQHSVWQDDKIADLQGDGQRKDALIATLRRSLTAASRLAGANALLASTNAQQASANTQQYNREKRRSDSLAVVLNDTIAWGAWKAYTADSLWVANRVLTAQVNADENGRRELVKAWQYQNEALKRGALGVFAHLKKTRKGLIAQALNHYRLALEYKSLSPNDFDRIERYLSNYQ